MFNFTNVAEFLDLAKYANVSAGNSKVGTIKSFSFPTGISCRANAPCAKGCYAKKGHFIFDNVKSSYWTNWTHWHDDPDKLVQSIVINIGNDPYFRWFVSGDCPSEEFFYRAVVGIAKMLPDTKFLMFTKQYEIVNSWIAENGALPDNLTVVFSNWSSFQCENPYGLPESYVRFKDAKMNIAIPENAHECKGHCGMCRAENGGCWALKHGESVVFNQH